MAPNRWQAIIWTNADPIHRRIVAQGEVKKSVKETTEGTWNKVLQQASDIYVCDIIVSNQIMTDMIAHMW